MKIELIKLKFNDTHSYKYKPFKYCCNEIKNNKAITFTNEDVNDIGGEYEDDGITIPQFCISYTRVVTYSEDKWEQTDNYPIQFCPHCGKSIEINIASEINASEKYNELSKLHDELWERLKRTDSRKEESELREKIKKIDNQIDGFDMLNEWNEE